MNCILYDHATITCTPLACTSNRANLTCKGLRAYGSTVFGPTCDALDTVLTGHQLPELQINDWLVFPNMGCLYGSCWVKFQRVQHSSHLTHLASSNMN
ncbi:arginine/diaminopimelate/ornithine decarboxylase [Populus alba x Populus x berolinensis]|nr:arginine/diaminopimelate/ornithine decarboxylase [Populus alba x Populus x berolinensis]